MVAALADEAADQAAADQAFADRARSDTIVAVVRSAAGTAPAAGTDSNRSRRDTHVERPSF
jgi:hypothetical protein